MIVASIIIYSMEQLRYAPQIQSIHPHLPRVLPSPHPRNFSPQEQKLKLIEKIHSLSHSNEALTDKNEVLYDTVLQWLDRFVTYESC